MWIYTSSVFFPSSCDIHLILINGYRLKEGSFSLPSNHASTLEYLFNFYPNYLCPKLLENCYSGLDIKGCFIYNCKNACCLGEGVDGFLKEIKTRRNNRMTFNLKFQDHLDATCIYWLCLFIV